MAVRTLALCILFVSTTARAGGDEPADPFAKFESAVSGVQDAAALETECESRLLPDAPRTMWMDVAAKISSQISGLERGQTLVLHNPEMVPGFRMQWDRIFRSVGLRVLGMRPIANFSRSQFFVQRVEPARGVEMRVARSTAVTSPGKFRVRFFTNRTTGILKEMIGLFDPGVFVFPHFTKDNRAYVMLRPEEPGIPIVDPFDEISGANYLPQPIPLSLIGREDPIKRAMSLMRAMVPEYLGFRVKRRSAFFLAAPDEVLGGAKSVFVALKRPLDRGVAGWQAWEVRPLLSRIQETAAGDGVLELNLQILLRNENQPAPDWYGERPEFPNEEAARKVKIYPLKIEAAKGWREKRWFAPNESSMWKFVSADFQEVNGAGAETGLYHGEYAISAGGSANLISLLPVKRVNGKILIGLTQLDSPAEQLHGETSRLWTVPIYRVYTGEKSLKQAVDDAAGKFEREFETEIKTVQTLGASFRTDPEVSSDLIHPFVVEVTGETASQKFAWYPLESLTSRYPFLRDARLMISLFRLEQALKGN